jgi:predicted NBD/HSP70 family sugar kinase
MELEAFTGLSKPAMSDLLRRLEGAELIRKDGEKAGTYGPKAGLWALRGDAGYVAGIDVTAHGIDIAVSDICGRIVSSYFEPHVPGENYDAGERIKAALQAVVADAAIEVSDIGQVVVGLPGIVDIYTGHLTAGWQLRNWEGFHVADALADALGHRNVLVENDVNLVALEERNCGAATGVSSFILVWIGEGIGGAMIQGGKLVRGSTGSAGELADVIVPVPAAGGGYSILPIGTIFDEPHLLEAAKECAVAASSANDVFAFLATAPADHPLCRRLGEALAYMLTGPIGMVDPHMVILGGPLGIVAGKQLTVSVLRVLSGLRITVPQIVSAQVRRHAARAGAIELALEHIRDRVFTGGSAARGLP